MNDIVKQSKHIEDELNESKIELQKMQDVSTCQNATMQGMKIEIEELKVCNKDGLASGDSSTSRNIDIEFEKLQNRSQMLDDVIKERNILKDQLCKMAGIEALLKKLKSRADDADRLEQEIIRLRNGKNVKVEEFSSHQDKDQNHDKHRYSEIEFAQTEQHIDSHRYSEIEAERNFLKQKLKMMDTMEAELILYKVIITDNN